MTTTQDIKIGDVLRDRNAFINQWVRVIDNRPDEDDFILVEQLAGDKDRYWVWIDCLSRNAHH